MAEKLISTALLATMQIAVRTMDTAFASFEASKRAAFAQNVLNGNFVDIFEAFETIHFGLDSKGMKNIPASQRDALGLDNVLGRDASRKNEASAIRKLVKDGVTGKQVVDWFLLSNVKVCSIRGLCEAFSKAHMSQAERDALVVADLAEAAEAEAAEKKAKAEADNDNIPLTDEQKAAFIKKQAAEALAEANSLIASKGKDFAMEMAKAILSIIANDGMTEEQIKFAAIAEAV